MTKRFVLLLLIFLLALTGCSAARSTSSNEGEAPMEAPGAAPAMPDNFSGEREIAPNEPSEGPVGQAVERLVIRNADLTIVVDDPGMAMSAIARMAAEMDGYVVASNLYKTSRDNGEYPEANIQVRVSAEKLNDALDQIKGLVNDPANDVRSENVTGQDVTKEYTDLNSRLRNYEETEAQLREIMASAVRTEDVLAVHSQLTQIREQIEIIKGQIQYYEEAAALSSITVRIQAQASVQPLEIGGWQPAGVARDAIQALIDTLQFLANAAIWIALFILPVLLVLALPFIGVWLIWRATRKNRKVKAAVPTQEG